MVIPMRLSRNWLHSGDTSSGRVTSPSLLKGNFGVITIAGLYG